MKKNGFYILFFMISLVACSTTLDSRPLGPESIATTPWHIDEQKHILTFLTTEVSRKGNTYSAFSDEIDRPFRYLEGDVCRISGSLEDGYGYIYCYDGKSNSYEAMITSSGKYSITEHENGKRFFVLPWQPSKNLIVGNGNTNKIRVEQKEQNHWRLFFNGKLEKDFFNYGPVEGSVGPVISVARNEDLPNVPVEVEYRTYYPEIKNR